MQPPPGVNNYSTNPSDISCIECTSRHRLTYRSLWAWLCHHGCWEVCWMGKITKISSCSGNSHSKPTEKGWILPVLIWSDRGEKWLDKCQNVLWLTVAMSTDIIFYILLLYCCYVIYIYYCTPQTSWCAIFLAPGKVYCTPGSKSVQYFLLQARVLLLLP
jgi:hypothetical protein